MPAIPFTSKAAQAAFTWSTADGLPVAQVVQIGAGLWVMCCPLCGRLHSLPASAKHGAAYAPACALKELAPRTFTAWQEVYPGGVGVDSIRLHFTESIEQPAAPLELVPAPAIGADRQAA